MVNRQPHPGLTKPDLLGVLAAHECAPNNSANHQYEKGALT